MKKDGGIDFSLFLAERVLMRAPFTVVTELWRRRRGASMGENERARLLKTVSELVVCSSCWKRRALRNEVIRVILNLRHSTVILECLRTIFPPLDTPQN